MKQIFIIVCLMLISVSSFAAKPRTLTLNGDTIQENTEFKRSQCGTLDIKENIIEVSGIACSRVTPGYIWMQSDEIETHIIATDEKGIKRFMKVNFSKKIRWDWEDLSGGVYNGINYLFIGAFGDNDETDGEDHIIFFPEPAIDPSTPEITITPSAIKYVYPDGIKHNTEALMYDNVEQMIYIITKKYYKPCQVFRIPFRLDYGSEVQTLEYVCDLGVQSDLGGGANPSKGFHLVTAADISPDGKYVLIKNQNNTAPAFSWVLLWERSGNESIAETVKRQPELIRCYETEWQGEAICWLNDYVFYTTSDSDEGNPPIFKYTRPYPEGVENVIGDDSKRETSKVFIDNQLYIRNNERLYTLDGRRVK